MPPSLLPPMLLDKCKALYRLPLCDVVSIVRNKISPVRVSPLERIAASKAMQPARPWEFLVKYETILARARGWEPLDFRGRHVLELGCGPLLGFLPLAVFRGAARCTAVEPGFNPGVLGHGPIVEGYFRPMWHLLGLLYGPGPTFEAFMAALGAVDVRPVPILEAGDAAGVDVVLSNSCLEHVSPLEASLTRVRAWCAPGVRWLHLVNFSNHLRTRDPFKGIYAMEPERYRRTVGGGLNLLRCPDVGAALAAAGFAGGVTPMDASRVFESGPVHPWWREHYGADDLAVRTALFSG